MTGPVFAKLPVEVFRDARLSARDLRILGLLYAFANREGRCWPSRRQLAALSGLPLGRVSTTTTRLARFGWLTKTGNGGRSRACRYRLHQPETLTDAVTVPEVVTVTEPVTQTVAEAVTKTVTHAGNGHGTDQEQTREQTTCVAELPGSYTTAFDHFWSAYPRRRHKGAAMKAWKALKPDVGLVAVILQALQDAVASDDWRREGGRFIPYPATWLNARGWEDEHGIDVVPLPATAGGRGEAARVASSITALQSLFGESHGTEDLSAGDGLPGGGLRHGAVEGAGGGVLGPARGPAR